MRLKAPRAGLILELDGEVDPAVAGLCHREIEAIDATLSAWGRFRQPVRLGTTEDRAELLAASPCPTDALLCAVARLDRLLVLAPQRWGRTPSPMQLEQTLVHELAHVLMFQRCTPENATREVSLPTWFREGMATVVAEGAPSPAQRRALAQHPALDDLPTADAALMNRWPIDAYACACSMFEDWMASHGHRRLSALCRAMRAGHGFSAAHARACGQDSGTWEKRWVEAVRAEAART